MIDCLLSSVSYTLYYGRMEGYMTLNEMAAALGLKNAESLRKAVRRGIIKTELIVTVEEVERYRREHLGKRGFRSPDHPFHGTRPPRKNQSSEGE